MDKINSVHTFDCRDNVMFQVIKEMMDIPKDKMLSEIQGYLELLRTHLSKKGIEYNDLKSCLVPNQERKEVALVFDRNKIEDSWYGAKVFEKLVPLLNADSKHSFLTGDFIVSNPASEKVRDIFLAQVNTHNEVDYVASNQFYVIYINNITKKGIEDITNGLREWAAYVGYADMTYNSVLKTLFSRCLVQTLIKYGKIIIQSSCGENPELEINTMGYCFGDYGYSFICVDDDMYGVFLCYKIERPVFEGFEEDTSFTLNAVTENVIPLNDMRVEVQEAKLNWLKQNKTDSLARANLIEIETEELEILIKQKIQSNYIYSIDRKLYERDKEVIKFNIVLEFDYKKKTRLIASLEYDYENRKLRLITLF
jgi:hypothetical protein